MSVKRLIIYADGASRGNPGPAAIGVVINDEDTVLAGLAALGWSLRFLEPSAELQTIERSILHL